MNKRLISLCGRSVAFLLILVFMMGSSYAQNRTVQGTVTTSAGKAIEGATVREKGSKGGTQTNGNGEFTVRVSGANPILVISYIGLATQEVSVGDQTTLSVQLLEDNKQMSEVVVTAMGVRKEAKRLGYSVQEVKGADLTKARDANPINSLAGKIAGLSVGANTEMLGRPDLVLRGSKDLLFVIDGVPVNTDTWNINPDDIESYTVLKGANAAAVYGFRGLNGPIVLFDRLTFEAGPPFGQTIRWGLGPCQRRQNGYSLDRTWSE